MTKREWHPMETAPKDRLIWVFSATDCMEYVKVRLAGWVVPIGWSGVWQEEETDCTLESPQCWCEADVPDPPSPFT